MTKQDALLLLVRAMGHAMIRIGMPVGEPKDELILGELVHIEKACADARAALRKPSTEILKKGKKR